MYKNIIRIKYHIFILGGNSHDDSLGCSPVHLAAAAGHQKVVEVLLEGDLFDVDAADVYGRTSLMKAAFGGYVQLLHFLIAKVRTLELKQKL
jgi:ankyrin repeat protein